jgi:hypothetical protein
MSEGIVDTSLVEHCGPTSRVIERARGQALERHDHDGSANPAEADVRTGA